MYLRRGVFVILAVAALLPMACVFPWHMTNLTDSDSSDTDSSDTAPSGTGILDVTIDYTGTWYRETFGYAPDAENIRHVVLVLSESEAERAGAGWILTSLTFGPDGFGVREDRLEYAWALDYLHDAPEGYFSGEFAPGTYVVAAAFLAAPLSREEAGVSEDTILWAGITGGGASTEYQTIVIEAGQTTAVTFTMTDDDGWG